jgi:predicted component of type VI protein secretion system
MTLVLHGVALNEVPMSRPLIGRFDERGGTLGRSDNATFTLPDPERMISRVQAQVLHHDDGYWLENVSTASPILHNGRPLSAGMRVLLRDGDEVRVGNYTLQAAFENNVTSATILRGRTTITRENTQPEPAPKIADVGASAPPASPVAPQRPAAVVSSGTPARRAGDLPPAFAEALWRSFLEGVGVDPQQFPAPSPELMSGIGAMLRIAVGGIHRLVAMRAMAKDEMQAPVTVIQVKGNNPLKFAPDAAVALQLLLQPPARGFLAGPAALREALIDLQSHQVGVMAGMRAALEAVLDRFDPARLEALLSKESVLQALLPSSRRARLWDVYLEHYSSVRDEAADDFERFFGEAFREAYEAQVRSLEAAHEATPAGPKSGGGAR